MLNTPTIKSARQLLDSDTRDANALLQGSISVVWKLNFSLFGRRTPNRCEHTHAHTRICHPPRPCPPAGTDGPWAGRRWEAERGSLPTARRDPAPAAARAGSTGKRAPPGRAAPHPLLGQRLCPRHGGREGRLPAPHGRTDGWTDGWLSPTRSRPPALTRCRCRGRPEPWGSAGRGRAGEGRAEVALPPPGRAASRAELRRPGAALPAMLALPGWGAVGAVWCCPAGTPLPVPCQG